MRRKFGLFLILLGLQGCNKSDSKPTPDPAVHASNSAESPAAAPEAPRTHKTEGPIPWRHDDYAAALAEAKKAGLPLVIDMWAPWCHTCLSMQHYVLSDATFAGFVPRFVWLAIDTDKDVNAALLDKLQVNVWPTFYVISSIDESIQAQHIGAASIKQFREFLKQGEGGHLDLAGNSGKADPILALMRKGDNHMAHAEYGEADHAYSDALDHAGENWPRRPEVLVSQIFARHEGGEFFSCVELGLERINELTAAKSASAADFSYFAAACAEQLGDAKKKQQIYALATAPDGPIRTALGDKNSPMSIDDRSDALRILRTIEAAKGNKEEATKLANEQRNLLDEAAQKATNAFERMTYHWPRAEVYDYLGEPAALIPDLKQSMKDLPDQYEPAYRLAWIYLKAGQLEPAADAAEAAIKRVYGPRKARAIALLADIHKASGDRAAEKAARKQIVELYRSLKAGHRNPGALEQAEKDLAEMDKQTRVQ